MVLVNDSHIIPAKGHKVASHKEIGATCFSEGVKAHYECRSCGILFSDAEGTKEISAPETIPTLSHELTKVDAKQPSGFVAGWEEHYVKNDKRIKTTELNHSPSSNGEKYFRILFFINSSITNRKPKISTRGASTKT